MDYFIFRRMEYDFDGLFHRKGPYWYRGGFNPVAMVALLVAVLPNLPGFLHAAGLVQSVPPIFDAIYVYAWFVGFGLAAVVYLVGMVFRGMIPSRPELRSRLDPDFQG